MSAKVMKVLDKGTRNHIVARTMLQISALLSPFPLPENEKKELLSTFRSLMRRLLRMQEIEESFRSDYEKIRARVRESGIKKLDAETYEIPQIMGLDAKSEDFLQATKLALIDCGALFGPLFGKPFDHRFDKAIAWLLGELGESNELVDRLEKHHVWIKQTLARRNALEHPKEEPEGRLHIRNIDIDIKGPKLMGSDPSWFLTGDEPTSIIEDTRILLENVLRLAEEILVSSLRHLFQDVPIDIIEIPEAKRNPNSPVRFSLAPRGNILGA